MKTTHTYSLKINVTNMKHKDNIPYGELTFVLLLLHHITYLFSICKCNNNKMVKAECPKCTLELLCILFRRLNLKDPGMIYFIYIDKIVSSSFLILWLIYLIKDSEVFILCDQKFFHTISKRQKMTMTNKNTENRV